MTSAFDDLTPCDAEYVRKRLLAGDRMHQIREGTDITARQMRKMRDEVFGELVANPEAVKALADGPILNPNEIIHYSHSRRAIKAAIAKQEEMFGENNASLA